MEAWETVFTSQLAMVRSFEVRLMKAGKYAKISCCQGAYSNFDHSIIGNIKFSEFLGLGCIYVYNILTYLLSLD